MRVALAEDGALFREGLLMLLQAAGHEVVGCTADGNALVELLSSRQPTSPSWTSACRPSPTVAS